jgi:cytochrome oxidase Cu insertion factor (SCO1/SenC/PrrC family)
VLAAYAEKAQADTSRWSFVTGPSQAMQEAVVLGFKMTMQRKELGTNDYDVLHGNWFVVGDARGVRGYFTTESDDDLHAIADELSRLTASR